MKCPKCGAGLADDAEFCHKCGSKLAAAQPAPKPASTPRAARTPDPAKSHILMRVRPGWTNFLPAFFLFFLVMPALLIVIGMYLSVEPPWKYYIMGLAAVVLTIPMISALIKRASSLLKITPEQAVWVSGLISTREVIVFTDDITAVEVTQSLWQRIVNTGNVSVGTSGTEGFEIAAKGFPNPKYIKSLILNRND